MRSFTISMHQIFLGWLYQEEWEDGHVACVEDRRGAYGIFIWYDTIWYDIFVNCNWVAIRW
jgi:hypothetical protein